MPRRYVQVSLGHIGFLERQVVKVDIVNKHGPDWLGWEPGEKLTGVEIDVYRDCATEGEFKKAVANLARRVGGREYVTEIGPPA
jgi:hypothetical protein